MTRGSAAIVARGVTRRFGRVEVLRGVDLTVLRGERHAVIGPNGAGKSTLFHVLGGRFRPSAGKVEILGRRADGMGPFRTNRLGLSRSFQVSSVFGRLSAFENIRIGALWATGYGYSIFRRLGRGRADEVAARVVEEVGLGAVASRPAATLGYAEQRALEIGICLASGAPVLVMDEPTAGMSRAETAHIVALLRRASVGRTLLVVEHDMSVVFDLADRISVLVDGRILATGTPEAIRADAAVRHAYLGAAAEPEARPC